MKSNECAAFKKSLLAMLLLFVFAFAGCATSIDYGVPLYKFTAESILPSFYFYLEHDSVQNTFTVADVDSEAPASIFLKQGDRLKSVEGTAVDSWDTLNKRALEFTENRKYSFTIERDGMEYVFNLVPALRPLSHQEYRYFTINFAQNEAGGVLVTHANKGKNADGKLFLGDVIRAVDEQPMHDLNDWYYFVNSLNTSHYFSDQKVHHFLIARGSKELMVEVAHDVYVFKNTPKEFSFLPFVPVLRFDQDIYVEITPRETEIRKGSEWPLTVLVFTQKACDITAVHELPRVGARQLEMDQLFPDRVVAKKVKISGKRFNRVDVYRIIFSSDEEGRFLISPCRLRIQVHGHGGHRYLIIPTSNAAFINVTA